MKDKNKNRQLQKMKLNIEREIENNIQSEMVDSNSFMVLEDFQFDEASFKQKKRYSEPEPPKIDPVQRR